MDQSNERRRIGIDFDNTIISYQQAFLSAAKNSDLLPKSFVGTKQAVRDQIRLLPDGEWEWMRLQGAVYGKGIGNATLIDGVADFLNRCRDIGSSVFIVSHKTEYGHFDTSGVNLRQAALGWMEQQGFFDRQRYGLAVESVYFETTRAEKLARIAVLNCTHFIDDLEEVLDDPGFPIGVRRILFADGSPVTKPLPYSVCTNWRQIAKLVFDERI
ncbi:MAG: hypothetical protein ABSE50_02930 [Xanthobacteraceae bacterium]|jgi:hypothetical protein